MEAVAERCLGWLSYGADSRELELPIKIASYSEGSHADGEGDAMGVFVIAMRRGQMYWAAMKLPEFYSDTALSIRGLPDRQSVLSHLFQAHGPEWASWRAQWPFNPFEKLRRHIAELMAQRLGENPL